MKYAASSIADYAKRTQQTVTAWQGMNGKQRGDPPKLAAALVQLTALDEPPPPAPTRSPPPRLRESKEDRAKLLLDQPDAHRDLSSHLDHDDA